MREEALVSDRLAVGFTGQQRSAQQLSVCQRKGIVDDPQEGLAQHAGSGSTRCRAQHQIGSVKNTKKNRHVGDLMLPNGTSQHPSSNMRMPQGAAWQSSLGVPMLVTLFAGVSQTGTTRPG